MTFNVKKLRCEYKENPIGIDTKRPRISWQVESDTRSWLQAAYQVQLSQDSEFTTLLWDSQKVLSNQSIHVEIEGLDLEACTRYHYRVRVWSDTGELSDWSDAAFLEMGLLHADRWIAEWISAPVAHFPLESETCPLLRHTFHVKEPVNSARIYTTSLGLYHLELNGRRVGDTAFAPGWTSYNHRLQYQTYEVSPHLTPGDNAVGVLLGNGWYKGKLTGDEKFNLYGDRTAFLFQLHIQYADGSEDIVTSNPDWKAAESPILMSEIYHGETYDARLHQIGWSTAIYDDHNWFAVETLKHAKDILVTQENEPVRRIEEISPVALLATPSGETVIDMGQNMVGWVRFNVQGHSGQEVTLQHAEVLDQEGNFYMDNLRKARQMIRYVLRGGESEVYEPHFTFQGFRYVKLTGFGESIPLTDFTGVVLHSDMARTGDFQCSNPMINQLQHNILWGQKGNFLDVPTDCPQRDERLGWTGDAQMFIRTSAFLMNVAPFFSKWLQDLAVEQLESGGVPFVIPHVLNERSHSSSAWGDAAVICPWVLYQCYGDTRILEKQYDSMKAWVAYIRKQGDNEFLWNTGFHFGDWLGLDAKPCSYVGATDRDFIAQVFYAYSVSLLAKTARVLGKEEDSKHYSSLHVQVRDAFQREFVTPAGRLSVPTQTAHVLALMFDMLDGAARERAVNKLIQLLEESNYHLTTGFVGTPYLNLVLSQAGHTEAAYRLLLQQDYPSWLYPITKGATTIWEHWDGIKEDGSFWSEDMNSFNHYAYGAVGEWLYRYVAGIDLDEDDPGYRHIHIRPQPGGDLYWAEAQLESMYGWIRSSWRKHGEDSMEVKITVPPNTTASVLLPNAKAAMLREHGATLNQTIGISNVREIEDGVSLTLGSGEYCFMY